ncbi:MAG: hypothetical protein KGS48_15270 [Bacteroidetes bacterium]|nr:hypothetical protein [Bacteroidota bacterium]
MESVKINVYISCTPDDKPDLARLLEWLYPMQNEVNIWYHEDPPDPEPLSLPWQLLLFWYSPPDQRNDYAKVMQQRLERAHIYLFITSHKSMQDTQVAAEITLAVQRYIQIGDSYLRIFPLIFRPSNWKDKSRLAHFKQLGPARPLMQIQPREEGFLLLTKELEREIKSLQRNLNEQKQALGQKRLGAGYTSLPDLGDDLEGIDFEPVTRIQPPEFLGWVIVVFLFIYVLYALRPQLPSRASRRLKNAPPREIQQPEFQRENPLMPPDADMPIPNEKEQFSAPKSPERKTFKPKI